MYHPTQREAIIECFDTQLLRWLSMDECDRLLKNHKEKYDRMCDMYVDVVEANLPDTLIAFRAGRDKLDENFTRDIILQWMNTGKLEVKSM